MSLDLPEREIEDFYFKALTSVQIFSTPNDQRTQRLNLLATSNKFGLTFGAWLTDEDSSEVKVFKTVELRQQAASDGGDGKVSDNLPVWSAMPITGRVVHIGLSSDQLSLSVTVERDGCIFANIVDVRGFALKGNVPQPFVSVRLGTANGVQLLDMCWNPGADYPSLFAACLNDGSVALLEVTDTLKIVASLPPDTHASCLCWSPKGKQLVVGKVNGSFTNYDQALKVKKEIPTPTVLTDGNTLLCDILWQSTFVYVCVYNVADAPRDPPTFLVVSTPKNAPVTYQKSSDICYGSGDSRDHKFYMHQSKQKTGWCMITASSTNAMETAIVGKKEDDKTTGNKCEWELWSLNDNGRAETPMTASYEETMPIGTAIDYTATDVIRLDEEKTHPASPVYMMLTTHGMLVMFHMIYKDAATSSNAADLMAAVCDIPNTGARMPKKSSFTTSTPAKAQPQTETSSSFGQQSAIKPTDQQPTPITSTGTSLFATKPTAQSGSTSQPFTFNSSATSTPAFSFNKPVTLQSVTQTPTTTPSFSFASAISTSSVTKPTTTLAAATIAPAAAATTTPAATAFGGFGAATSVSGTLVAQPSAARGNALAAAPVPGTTTTNPPAASSPASATQPIAKPSPQIPSSPRHTPQPQAVIAGHHTPPAVGGTLTKPQTQPTPPTKQLSTSEVHTDVKDTDHFYMDSICNEMKLFQKEINDLRTHCSSSHNTDIGSEDEMIYLQTNTNELQAFSTEIKKLTESQNMEIVKLKSEHLDAFSMVDECQRRHDQHNVSSGQKNGHIAGVKSSRALQQKALDPASMKRLKDIRAQYRYVEATIRDVDMQLDARWELHHKKTKKANYKPTPATDHIYDTLSANQKVIINQLTFIEQLRQEMSKIKLQKTTPTAHSKISDDAVTSSSPNASFGSRIFGDKSPHTAGASRTNTPSHLSYNSSARSGTSPSAAGGSPAPAAHFGHQQSPTITVSPEKQAKLRDHLSRRTITPVKSTIPANLSISKLSSGESFRHRLSEEINQTAQSSPSKSTIGTPAAIASPSKLALQQPTPTNQNSSSMAASRSIAGSNSAASVAGMKVPTLPAMALTGNTLGSRASAQPSSSSTAVATTSITTPTSAASTTQAGFFFKPTSSTSKSPSKAESTTSPGSGLLQQNPSAPQSGFSFGSSSSGVSFSSFDASASTAGLFPTRTTASSMPSSIPSVTSTTSSTSSAFLVPSSASGSTGSQSFTIPSSKPVTSGFSFTNKANEVSGFGTPAAITGSLAPVSTTSTALFGATAAQSTQQLSFTDVSSTTLPTFKPADKVDAQDKQDVDSTTGTPGSVFGGGGNSSLFGSAGSGGTSAASSFSFTASSTTVSSSVTSGATAKFTFDSSSSSTATSASPSPVLGQKAGGLFGTNSTFSGFGGSSGSTSKQEATLPPTTSQTSAATTSITTPANTAQANAADSPASPTPSPRASPPIQPVTPVKSSPAPVPTLTTSDASPAQPTPSLSIFGNAASSINGSSQPSAAASPTVPDTTAPPKTTSSLFGNLMSSTTVSSAPVFGGNASASFSGFGSIAASGSSVFGSASTTSASFTFNTSSSTTASATGSAATTATAATTTATAATTTATAATTTATSSTTATTTPSLFGLTTSAGPSVFGSSVVTSSSASGGGTSLFGASAVTTSTSSGSGSSLFGSGTVATSTSAGGGSSSLFGSSTIPASTSSSGGSSLFGGATTTSSSLFATTSTSTTTGQIGGLFGSAGSGGSSSVFGGTAPPSTSSSIGSTSGGGLFGSAAGASSGGAGGTSLFGGSALFGTQTTSATAPSLFGTTSVSASAAPATEIPAGTSGGLFGSGGGVFGGLGGTPSAENANKNVFGATTFGTSSQQNTGLFGSGGATSFSSPAKSQASTFGGGFNAPASGGFGGFQSSSTPTGSAGAGGFGSPPAFGGAPSFGGGGTGFGSKATFSSPLGGAGGSSATAGSIFGQGAAAATGAGFASFADSNTSTFGALSQGAPQGSIFGSGGGSTAQPTGFGELSQQGTSGGIFGGSAAATSPGFGAGAGAGAGGGGGFGGNASFGSPQQGSAFTSHRG